ncbi:MAG TPA: hypothetical protein VLW17_13285 [Thermoanaerobaculaceae bacterium]|nr:hypothetical protein [Thermoanaerobaculaceae bacterium]
MTADGSVHPSAAPLPAAVSLSPHVAAPGATLLASGTVPFPGQTYCLCLVPNGFAAAPDTPTPTPTSTPTATMTPTPTPTTAPTQPVISLGASCTLDAQGTFTITNVGTDMLSSGTYTLLLNGAPIATGNFQLLAGKSTDVHTSGLFGTLELDVSGGGIASPVSVSTFCVSPTATPTPVPPTVSLEASCTPDAQGTFTITDTGADMPSPGTYTLLLNGTAIATDTFQLKAGASTAIHTSGLFGTLELDVSGGGLAAPSSVSTFCMSPTATPTPTTPPSLPQRRAPTPRAHGVVTVDGRQVWPRESGIEVGALATGIACVASVEITPAGATFADVPITAPAPGSYDLLLLDGPCGQTTATVLAIDAAGDASGLVVVEPVPTTGRLGLVALFVALALGAWYWLRSPRR